MQRYIAFLRAINVGGHNVTMDRLRTLFEELEYANVATFIASGNVIFESPARNTRTLERKIEDHLRQSLGYEVATFIRSAAELAAIAEYQPFPAADLPPEGSIYITFLSDAPAGDMQQRLQALPSTVDEFHIHEREIYRLCRTKFSESPLFTGTLFEKAVGVPSTTRKTTTIGKLAAKYGARGK